MSFRCVTAALAMIAMAGPSWAIDLNPHYTPRPQTDNERLQTFRPPPPANNSLPSNLNLGRGYTVNPGTGATPEVFPRGTGFGANVRKTF